MVQVRRVRHSLAISYLSKVIVKETLISSNFFSVFVIIIIVYDDVYLVLLLILWFVIFVYCLQIIGLFNL